MTTPAAKSACGNDFEASLVVMAAYVGNNSLCLYDWHEPSAQSAAHHSHRLPPKRAMEAVIHTQENGSKAKRQHRMPVPFALRRGMFVRGLFLLVLALLLTWQAFNAWSQYRQTVSDGYRTLEISTRQRASRLSAMMQRTAQLMTRIIEEDRSRQLDSARLQEYLLGMPELRALFVLSTDGIIRASSNESLIGRNASPFEYAVWHLEHPDELGLHVSRPFETISSRLEVVTLSLPIFAHDGALQGIVVATPEPSLYLDILHITESESGQRAMLLNTYGDIIGTAPEEYEDFIGDSVRNGAGFKAHIASGESMTHQMYTSSITGEQMAAVYLNIGETGLISVSILTRDTLLQTWLVAQFKTMPQVLTILLLVAALALLASRQVRQIEAANRFSLGLIETANDIIIGLDREGAIRLFNGLAETSTGYARADVLGKPLDRLLAAESDSDALLAAFLAMQSGNTSQNDLESLLKTRDGRTLVVNWRVTPVPDNFLGIVVVAFGRDISDLRAKEADLIRLATTDALTGLFNRHYFLQQANHEIARARRNHETPLALIMLDLDLFKDVNDTWGHLQGDRVLQALARVLVDTARKTDIAGRLGGEEFSLLLPETDADHARVLAERLRLRIAESLSTVDGIPIRLTASLGVTILHPKDERPEDLLARADKALYRAKHEGRNCVRYQNGEPVTDMD